MKIPAVPPVGHVVAYEYLWMSKAGRREDGEKVYAAAIIMARKDIGPTPIAFVLGISHMPLPARRRALQAPAKLKRHLGLDDAPSWIYTDELNIFAWPGPDLRPASYLSTLPSARDTCIVGALPGDWFKLVTAHLAQSHRLGGVATIRRSQ